MNKSMQGYVDLYASVQECSIALNGLLKLPGKLSDVKYFYCLDISNERKRSKDNEINLLYATTFKNIKSMNIQLEPLNDYMTRFKYTAKKKSPVPAIIGGVFLQLWFAILLSLIINFIAFDDFNFIFTGILFIFFVSIFSLFIFWAISPYWDKNIDKRIKNNFIERLTTYIDIVKSQKPKS